MGILDNIGGVLKQYTGNPGASSEQVEEHFSQVASAVPQQSLASGIAEAFRSQQTPPFPQLVSHLFSHANPQQRSGMLSALLSAAGPSLLSGVAGRGGGLGNLIGAYQGGGVTPQHTQQLTPSAVQELAGHIEQQNPSVVDHMGGFFSQHPELIKTLGGGALGTILSKVGQKAA